MAKVFLICGKICSGKGFYTRQLKEKEHAVVLSCDEIAHDHDLGDRRDAISADIKAYLHKKAVDIARAGCNVILDWGFWSRKERADVSAYYKNADIDFEWHYIDISDADWAKNMEARNAAVAAGETTDYAVDSGLLQKILTLFETPTPDEIDVWFTNRR